MTTGWKIFLVVVVGVAAAVVSFNQYRTHERLQRESLILSERGQSLASIQSQLEGLKVRQSASKARFDALSAEMAKAPNDPALLKSFHARHLELNKEDEAIKSELDRLQKEIDANKQ
jgi:hypothetical protein